MKNHPLATILVGLLVVSGATQAADVARNNSVQDLNLGAAWVGGTAPGAGDVALWTAGSRSGASTNNQLNNNASWQGIASDAGFTSYVTINTANASTLTLGSAGIQLAGTGGDFSFTLPTVTLGANQAWISNSGRQLVMTSDLDLGGVARTISIGNPDAASVSNKVVINRVSGGSSLTLANANATPLTSPVWVQLAGSSGAGIQTDLTIGEGVLTYFSSSPSLASTANLTVQAGGVFDVSTKGTSAITQTVASLAGAGTITNNRSNGNTNVLIVNGGSGVSSTFSGSFVNGVGEINLTKQGDSVLILDGTSTTSGVFAVQGGVLRLSSAGAFTPNGNLWIDGGVVELGTGNSSFSKALGSGANQVRLRGGGFGAVGADATVTLGSSVQWGSGYFNPNNEALVFSSDTSTHKVTFATELNLGTTASGAGNRTIEVQDGGAAVDAEVSGVIRNLSVSNVGSLIKAGDGTLELSAANTYTGSTTINAGTLLLTGSLASASAVTVNTGGKFAVGASVNLSNEITVNAGGRIGGNGTYSDTTGIILGSGAIASPGNSAGNTIYSTDLTLESAAIYEWELGAYGTGAGTDSDLLTITGAGNVLTFESGSLITLNFLSPVVNPNSAGTGDFWLSNQQWLIAEAVSGGVIVDNGLAIQAPTSFTNGDFSLSASGGNLYLDYTAVPEPGTSLLVGLGFAGLLYSFRRRRA